MSTLAEFLLARIAEDEAAARRASRGPWWRNDSNPQDIRAADQSFVARTLFSAPENEPDPSPAADAAHIARHDPARVLAECEAKRRIVRWVGHWPLRPHSPSSVDGVLEILALPYAAHPDYREEWKP